MTANMPRQPQPATPTWSYIYNYTSTDCRNYLCRKCWQCISTAGAQFRVPSAAPADGRPYNLWITPHFFRFQEEAQRYLALPKWNRAERGLYLNISPTAVGDLAWRREPAQSYPEMPGGALIYELRGQPLPIAVVEVFDTILQGDNNQQGGAGWPFQFGPM